MKLRGCGISRKQNPCEMGKSFCRSLIKADHVQVANFKGCKYYINAIRENKIVGKISEFTVVVNCAPQVPTLCTEGVNFSSGPTVAPRH